MFSLLQPVKIAGLSRLIVMLHPIDFFDLTEFTHCEIFSGADEVWTPLNLLEGVPHGLAGYALHRTG